MDIQFFFLRKYRTEIEYGRHVCFLDQPGYCEYALRIILINNISERIFSNEELFIQITNNLLNAKISHDSFLKRGTFRYLI